MARAATRRRRPARAAGLFLLALTLATASLWLATPLPSAAELNARVASGGTRLLDRSGRLIYEAHGPLGGTQRPVPLAEIPLALRNATVAIEDASFYSNPGVDLRGILRAARTNLEAGAIVAGGSTITQQLVRSTLLSPQLAGEQSLSRKAHEATLALKLSAALSKDEILELYLNHTYYGALAYGVEAAARRYFGKPAADLNLAESALLAGLPQAPSRFNPLLNSEAAHTRQAQVLDAMVRAGFITPAQAATAKAEPLAFAGELPAARAPHFAQYTLDALADALGPDALARGGLVVTTTLDLGLQESAERSLRRQLDALRRTGGGRPDHRVGGGAVVVLDPRDGAILAMVGSPELAAPAGHVNAALAPRQPGSAIKPLTYAAALERGWTPATTILDVPTSFPTREGRPYAPQNYDRAFHGPLPLREALATSSNIAAVRTLDAIGIPALLDIADRLGITTLGQDPGRYGLALTLGGGEVTLLELTAAYAAFANGGQQVTPYAIVGVSRNHAITQSRNHAITQSLDPRIAFLISDILSDPYARMRAFGRGGALDIGRPAAVKTGTTTDWRDNWTVGYTPDRAVGVWVGNPDGTPMVDVTGLTGAAPVWHQVMLAAHRNIPPRPFPRPPGIVEVTICAASGLLPAPACPATRAERFVAGTEPNRPDDTHVRVAVDPQLGCRAPHGYPPARTETRTFRILPPEAGPWAAEANLPRPPSHVCSSDTARRPEQPTSATPASLIPHPASRIPSIVSPAPGAVFAIAPGVPRDRQRIVLEAAADTSIGQVTLVLNDEPLARFTAPPFRALWQLEPGRHRLHVVTTNAAGTTSTSQEVEFVVQE
jgi:penicillin-binding protein 1C